jgi:hypothetical protein
MLVGATPKPPQVMYRGAPPSPVEACGYDLQLGLHVSFPFVLCTHCVSEIPDDMMEKTQMRLLSIRTAHNLLVQREVDRGNHDLAIDLSRFARSIQMVGAQIIMCADFYFHLILGAATSIRAAVEAVRTRLDMDELTRSPLVGVSALGWQRSDLRRAWADPFVFHDLYKDYDPKSA